MSIYKISIVLEGLNLNEAQILKSMCAPLIASIDSHRKVLIEHQDTYTTPGEVFGKHEADFTSFIKEKMIVLEGAMFKNKTVDFEVLFFGGNAGTGPIFSPSGMQTLAEHGFFIEVRFRQISHREYEEILDSIL